jgi:hypothetical protein
MLYTEGKGKVPCIYIFVAYVRSATEYYIGPQLLDNRTNDRASTVHVLAFILKCIMYKWRSRLGRFCRES